MGGRDSDSIVRAVSVDDEDECVLPCTYSPGAYVEVVGHFIFGNGYEGSWHGAKVVRCHKPANGRSEWTYDIELVERAVQARQRRQLVSHIPADALRPQCPVEAFPDFCRLEPGLVVEHMLPEAPSVWWVGVVVQLEGCPIKSAVVGYPVTPEEDPGFANTATHLRPAFHWDYETTCWCSIWQSQLTPEQDVQKCFNKHFKRHMGLPRCARVGSVVPRVQAVGTDYIGTDSAPQLDIPSPRAAHAAATAPHAPPQLPAHTPLPPLAASSLQAIPPQPPSTALESQSKAANASLQPPALKQQHAFWGPRCAAPALPEAYPYASASPASMLRSHSSSISGTHQHSGLRVDVGTLEATRSDAKYACLNERPAAEAPCPPDTRMPSHPGDPWMNGAGAHLLTMAQQSTDTAWPPGVPYEQPPVFAQPARTHSGPARTHSSGALGVCNHAWAEFKKQVSRAQLMRNSSGAGVPGSVQLAAALGAVPDCSSPHAMESAATAVMQPADNRDSGGSGSAVCGSSDISGACMAERRRAGRGGKRQRAGAAAMLQCGAAAQAGALDCGPGALGGGLPQKHQLSAVAGRLPEAGPSGTVTAPALMQRQPLCHAQPHVGRNDKEQAKMSPADSLRMLTDVSEQEEAAVGLLCLRHHPNCWGVVEPGFWQCKNR